MKKVCAVKFLGLAAVAFALSVSFASCSHSVADGDGEKVPVASLSAGKGNFTCASSSALAADGRPLMVLTALPFELEGQRDVDCFKLHWNEVEGAAFYRLFEKSGSEYRVVTDGLYGRSSSTGDLYGTVFDVYGLGSTARYYKAASYDESGDLIAETGDVECRPFGDYTQKVYDNTKNSSFEKADTSLSYGGKYWRYVYIRSSRNQVSLEEQWSLDGNAPWNSNGIVVGGNPDDFADGTSDKRYCSWLSAEYNGGTGCKFESTSYLQRSDGTVINWSHYENGKDYSLGKVICVYGVPGSGVFTVESEPYHPCGNESRDLGSFVDSDGSAYIIGSTSSAQTLYKLDDTWTKVDESFEPVTLYSGSREAPCFMKLGDWYYMFSSEQQGWMPTQGAYISGKTFAELASCPLQNTGNRATFGGQSGWMQKFGDNYGMMANRWIHGWGLDRFDFSLGYTYAARYLPVSYCEGYAFYDFFPEIHYDEKTGTVIPVQRGRLVSLGKADEKLSSAKAGTDEHGNTYDVSLATDGISWSNDTSPSWGNLKNYYMPSASGEYYVTVNLRKDFRIGEVDVTFRQVGGSEPASHFVIEGCRNSSGFGWEVIKDQSGNYLSGFVDSKIDNPATFRMVRVRVTGMHDVNPSHGTSGNWWARGIHEISVYGYEE